MAGTVAMSWPQQRRRCKAPPKICSLSYVQNLVPVPPFLLRHWYSTCLSARGLPMEVYRYSSKVCLPTCCAPNMTPTVVANKAMPVNQHISFNPSKYSCMVGLKAVSHTNVKGENSSLHLYRYVPGCEGAGAPHFSSSFSPPCAFKP